MSKRVYVAGIGSPDWAVATGHVISPAGVPIPVRRGIDPCPYTVGKRRCVAGAYGHGGRHDWPKVAK